MRRGEGEDLSGPPSIARVDGWRSAPATPACRWSCVVGRGRAAPAGVDLAAYRIVQEALTNAYKHAGSARARVHIRYEPHELVLEVRTTAWARRGPS